MFFLVFQFLLNRIDTECLDENKLLKNPLKRTFTKSSILHFKNHFGSQQKQLFIEGGPVTLPAVFLGMNRSCLAKSAVIYPANRSLLSQLVHHNLLNEGQSLEIVYIYGQPYY